MKSRIGLFSFFITLISIAIHATGQNATSGNLRQKTSEAPVQSYVENSILAEGTFYKVKVSDSGIYKLTFEDLTSMGVDPANVRIFGYGGAILDESFSTPKPDDLPEISIRMEKGADGIFNAGDYILFYAQGIDLWSYNTQKELFTHRRNCYSDAGYYFISSDAGTGKKITEKSIELPENPTIHVVDEFTDYQVHELDKINLINAGKEFYGETFKDITSYDFTFGFPNLSSTEDAIRVNLNAAAQASENSEFVLTLNGQSRSLSVAPNSYNPFSLARPISGIFTFSSQNDNLTFGLSYSKPNDPSIGYLNYIEVNARRRLTMSGSAMPFRNIDYTGAGSFNRYMLNSSNPNIEIWDITNQTDIIRITTEDIDDKISFTDSNAEIKQYLAIDPTDAAAFPKPEIIGAVPAQNLHALPQTEMVIIVYPDFLTQAEALAQAHRAKDNMTVAVVTTEQVYNEFSSGTPDVTAYRRLMKMFYDRGTVSGNSADMPGYLLLFGQGSFDNRKILPDSGDNFILTYQADQSTDAIQTYVTDDYFTYLEDREGATLQNNSMDISVGRLPVTTQQQATAIVNKLTQYMNNTNHGIWKDKLCFTADDGDGNTHMSMADSIASYLTRNNTSYDIRKIYLDNYELVSTEQGLRYPAAKTDLLNTIQEGVFVLNYTGNGHIQALAFEQILTNTDIDGMSNDRQAFWIGMTSGITQFDSGNTSLGESALLNPSGGAIGVFSAAHVTFASYNLSLNYLLNRHLFSKVNGQHLRTGDAIRKAKNSLTSEINKISYIYLGDPALMLNYPDQYQVITSMINNESISGNDTLRANSTNTIKGSIVDENQNKITDFNGTVQITLRDKPELITTRRNDVNTTTKPFTYSERPVVFSSGEIQVTNGDFSYSFTMPEDIQEDYGSGLIRYYAQDNNMGYEALGYFSNFIIGGKEMLAGIDSPEASVTEVSITNYPNPAKEATYFVINRQEADIIQCTIEISDLSGKSIYTIPAAIQNKISWNLTTGNGQKVAPGVYFYRSTILTTDNKTSVSTGKIIVN